MTGENTAGFMSYNLLFLFIVQNQSITQGFVAFQLYHTFPISNYTKKLSQLNIEKAFFITNYNCLIIQSLLFTELL